MYRPELRANTDAGRIEITPRCRAGEHAAHRQRAPAPRILTQLRGMLTAAAVSWGVMGLGATSYGLAVVRDIAAALPPTPDAATLPVSPRWSIATGQLLRPSPPPTGAGACR
jgi:hypothetical protein